MRRDGGGGAPAAAAATATAAAATTSVFAGANSKPRCLLGPRPPPGLGDKEGHLDSRSRERGAKESWDPIPAPRSMSQGSEGGG